MVDLSRMDPFMTVVFIAFGILIIFQSAEYWQRVYAAKSDKVVKRGLIGSAILVILSRNSSKHCWTGSPYSCSRN
jgi:hypothetical protein